ncbi:MAG: sigma-54-dependent transcriptional regulator [Acidobacteriota bacterium]
MRKGRILLVEDDPNLRRVLAYHLEKHGHSVTQAMDADSALERAREEPFDLVITDVRMPRTSGIELLSSLTEQVPGLPVVVMTAYGTIADAVEAMRRGAADYLTKPIDQEALLLVADKAMKIGDLDRENRRLRRALEEKKPQEGIVAASAPMQQILETVRRVAPTEATVLITGESGTGKELIARALHAQSSRREGPFVAVNCAALPRDLLESELFGHERGAFTGATDKRQGKFVQAHGGTLLLDEIGDMDLGLQAKILRVLQERVVDPVGGRRTTPVDVRVIAATNQDLEKAVEAGAFRRDLFYRLNVIPIHVPPLRERGDDVRLLLRRFLMEYSGGDQEVSMEAMAMLESYSWPGNVRELQNLCQRLAILCRGGVIGPEQLPREFRKSTGGNFAEEGGLWALEREAILKALRESRGNRSAAARSLHIPRHVLLYRLKKFGIEDA